jgi:hypothetical protein
LLILKPEAVRITQSEELVFDDGGKQFAGPIPIGFQHSANIGIQPLNFAFVKGRKIGDFLLGEGEMLGL